MEQNLMQDASQPAPPSAAAGNGGALSQIAAQIRAKIKIPAELKDAYKRLMTAAVNIMFQGKTHDMMLRTIKSPGDLGKNVGEGAAGLVLLLYKQSKEATAKLMIPVGMEIVLQTFEYIEKTDVVAFKKQDVGAAVQAMIEMLLKSSGTSMAAVNRALGAKTSAPAGGAAPAQGTAPARP